MTKNIQRLKNNIYDFIFQFVKLSRVKPKIIKALDLDAISRKNLLEAREGLRRIKRYLKGSSEYEDPCLTYNSQQFLKVLIYFSKLFVLGRQ